MIAGVGMAVDVVVGYLFTVATERAAAAAALSGVVFMPDQFDPASAVPAGSRNDAFDRAIDEANRNGFDAADLASGISVTPRRVAGHPNRLQVTVTRSAPVFFMEAFGFKPYQVSKTAVATYLPPISLGEPGSQLGASLGELGRTRFFFMRTEGWAIDRGEGDAFTPSPFNPPATAGASDDVHRISYVNGNVPQDATVSDRGGYNYRITVPSSGPGGVVQVYNAVFAPDGYGPTANFCSNDNQNPAARSCSTRGNNWMREEEWGPSGNYSAMRYSLYRVTNLFIRSSDVLLSQLTVFPIDARNWRAASQQYTIMGGPSSGTRVDQRYTGGLPTNMLIYHNWVDVTSYDGAQDSGAVSLRTTPDLMTYQVGGALQPGTYRLRVDTLDHNAMSFTGSTTSGHKGYAVRTVNGDMARTTCTTCQMAAWDEMCFITTFDAGPGGNFSTNLFQLGPDYAGLTVSIDIWDVGDIASASGRVVINILDPSGNVASAPGGINIYNLGSQRSNLASKNYVVMASAPGNRVASFVAQDTRRGLSTDNEWVHLEIPIPSTYNPAPGQYWWSLQYITSPGTVAFDTVTVGVGLKGGPVHLIP
jgi:hypothetical protein